MIELLYNYNKIKNIYSIYVITILQLKNIYYSEILQNIVCGGLSPHKQCFVIIHCSIF